MQSQYTVNHINGTPVLIDGAVNLSAVPYSATLPGIYKITQSGAYNFLMPSVSAYNDQVVIISNVDTAAVANVTGDIDTYVVPAGSTYFFVSDGNLWRKFSAPGSMYTDGSFFANNSAVYPLPRPGVYVMRLDNYKPDISLPDPIEYDGQSIVIFHRNDDGYYSYDLKIHSDIYNTSYQVVSNPFEMIPDSVLKLISCGGVWRKQYYSAD